MSPNEALSFILHKNRIATLYFRLKSPFIVKGLVKTVKDWLNFRLKWKVPFQKPPYKVRGIKKLNEIETFFCSDHELTIKKAPYKVEGYYFHSRRGQMTVLGGYHLGSKNFLAETVKFFTFSLATT